MMKNVLISSLQLKMENGVMEMLQHRKEEYWLLKWIRLI